MALIQTEASRDSSGAHIDRGSELADCAELARRRGDRDEELRLLGLAAAAQEAALAVINPETENVTYAGTALSTAVLWVRAGDLRRARTVAERALQARDLEPYYTTHLREISQMPDNVIWSERHEQSERLEAAAQAARLRGDIAEGQRLSAQAAQHEEAALAAVIATDLARYGDTAHNLVRLWKRSGDLARARAAAERALAILEPASETWPTMTLSQFGEKIRDAAELPFKVPPHDQPPAQKK